MKTRNNIFVLDKYEAARAAELFGQAAPPERGKALHALLILALMAVLAAFLGAALAADEPSWSGTAEGLRFTLRYDASQDALLRVGGHLYDCDITGRDPRPGAGDGSKAYSIVGSSGGRCDAYLGGAMEVGAPRAGRVSLKIRNGTEAREAILQQR